MPIYLIVGNIFSFLASFCTAVSVIKKHKTDFMHWQVGSTLFAVLTNIALSSYAGATTTSVSLVRNILAYRQKLSFIKTLFILTANISLGLIFNNRGFIGLFPDRPPFSK